MEATGLQVSNIFQLLVSEVVDSAMEDQFQKWQIRFWQGVEDLILKLLIIVQITWNLCCV